MEKRIKFDFEVDLLNGGGIQGQDFRLDIDGEGIEDQALADAIVRDLRLLMVGEVRILNKSIISEPHKRGAARDPGEVVADDASLEAARPSERRRIDRAVFVPVDVAGKAVLVHTGWDAHWRTDRYFEGHPFLTEAAARHLRDAGAALVGIDSLNIDDTDDLRRPVHTTLLGAGIPIVEHLRGLEQLPITGFHFSAVPAKVQGMGTFPVRAYATLQQPPRANTPNDPF